MHSGKKIQKFVERKIGNGRRLISCPKRDFKEEHLKLVHSFPSSIRLSANGKKPGFGHKAKVIDLYLKTLCFQREPLGVSAARKLRERLHVPLDRFVLNWVGKHFMQDTNLKSVKKSDLKLAKLDKVLYDRIQKVLSRYAKKARTVAILCDDVYTMKSA